MNPGSVGTSGSALAVFINGLPGSGKSTVARRLVATRPGWFLLDIDELRTSVGGWSDDFVEAGRIVRPVAQGIVSEVVASGGVVVIPQLIYEVGELLGFARKARDAGGDVVHVVIEVPAAECWRRLQARASDDSKREDKDSLVSVVAAALEDAGGEAHLERLAADLSTLGDCEFPTHVIPGEDVNDTLEELRAVLAHHASTKRPLPIRN